jgi:hypothetical protein
MASTNIFYSANIFCYSSTCKLQEPNEDDIGAEVVLPPPLHHDIYKRLFNETKKKIKVQIVEKKKMFHYHKV